MALLRGQLRGLLPERSLRLGGLSVHAANALHQLGLLRGLTGLRLLQLCHLHGGLRVKARLLKLLLRSLKPQLALLTGKLTLKACLLRRQLSSLLAKTGLLASGTDFS